MSWQLLEVAQAIDAANDVLLFASATHTHGHMYSFEQISVILHISVSIYLIYCILSVHYVD